MCQSPALAELFHQSHGPGFKTIKFITSPYRWIILLIKHLPLHSLLHFFLQTFINGGHLLLRDQPAENCQDRSKILCPSSHQMSTKPSAIPVQDGIVPLLGNPYFTSIMSEGHIDRDFILKFPSSFLQLLPSSSALVVLNCRSNEWVVKCCVYDHKKQLENGWEKFVVDNNLRIGDGCVFELMNFKESFPLKFRVQILDGQIPPTAQARVADVPSPDCFPIN